MKEKSSIGLLLDYEPVKGFMYERINLDTVVDFLQKDVGNKSHNISKF